MYIWGVVVFMRSCQLSLLVTFVLLLPLMLAEIQISEKGEEELVFSQLYVGIEMARRWAAS